MRLASWEASSLEDAWFQGIYKILDEGREFVIDKGSYAGQKRLEFDYLTAHITQPWIRPLAPQMPEGLNIPPPTTEEYIHEYMPYLMTDHKAENEDYTYGERFVAPKIRMWENEKRELYWEKTEDYTKERIIQIGPSSIDSIIKTYKDHGPRNNQMILQCGMSSDILLDDPPCLRHIDTRIQDNYLHFMIYFRSWDLWNGFPVNLGGIQLLKEYMASEIGVKDGEMIVSSKGLHLYDYVVELAEMRCQKQAKNRI
ncbi:MAG: thymidylate synthase [Nanoarchaeota archaeon]|nr:thymidylate synthase [Nanoarchaeota archaeon]